MSRANTGSTDLRDTDVQQPNTATTLSFSSSSAAFSANSGQFEAGSTTTASTFLPKRPPLLLRSAVIIRIVSLSVVSLIAIVPDSECSTPILIVSCACAGPHAAVATSAPANATAPSFSLAFMSNPLCLSGGFAPLAAEREQNPGHGYDQAGRVPAYNVRDNRL